ncbi:MAG: inverse autotransporter beta domain-containing protein [Planctomycetaceae bacterium]
MTQYLRRQMSSSAAMTPWLWWTGLFAVLVLGPTTALLSAEGEYFSMIGDSPLFSDQVSGRSGEALGAVARGGYFTGPAVGREKGIAPIELMPYMFFDQGMILGDIRGFRADNGYWGSNLGLGYRHYVSPWDRIFGVNFFYDYDNTSTRIFRQICFGLETYGQWWDMRANAYFPVGTQQQLLQTDLVPNSLRFSGHQLLFNLQNTYGTALKGADAEVGIPLSIFGDVAQTHDMRVYAGGYHYESDASGGFNGWSGRLQGNLIPSLLLQLIVTNDSHFDTNVVFGATWSYGGFKQAPEERQNQFSRMTTPIWRQYTISIDRTNVLLPDQVARNPNTGDAYFFDHVASSASGGNGTVENPWTTIAQANADPNLPTNGDGIVFVHAGSVYSTAPGNAISLISNIRYLGEGDNVTHNINILGLGNTPLPRATTNAARPLFTNISGNGVNLVSNTEFSGFQLGDANTPGSGPTGIGIFGTNVSNVVLNYNDVNYSGGDGMFFNNVGTGIVSAHSAVFNPGGIGFHVDGGTPNIRFSGGSISGNQDITNTGNPAVVIQNTLVGSQVDLSGSTINNSNSTTQGVLIENVAGTVRMGSANITNSQEEGIKITNSSGGIQFQGDVSIQNSLLDSILIENLSTTTSSAVFNSQVTINQRNKTGINLENNQGTIRFNGDTIIGDFASGTDAGISWQNNTGSTIFRTVTIADSGGAGFALGTDTGNNGGTFSVTGDVTIGQSTTGTLAGPGVDIANNFGTTSNINFASGLSISLREQEGIRVLDNNGQVNIGGITTINNENASTDSAVDLRRNGSSISFATLNINDATGTGSSVDPNTYGVGMNIVDNPGFVNVSRDLTITATDGIALFALNAGNNSSVPGGLSIADGSLSSTSTTVATGTPTIDISNSSYSTINLTSVTSTNSSREGIRLVNNARESTNGDANGKPTFTVTGVNNTAGSGGTISQAAAEGVLARNTGIVQLANMNFLNNLVGIRAETTDATLPTLTLAVNNLQISNSTQQGIYAVSTENVTILNSTFSGNGGGGDIKANDVRLIANLIDPDATVSGTQTYFWGIQNSNFDDAANTADIADTIFASNVKNPIYSDITGGGLGATVVLTALSTASNTISVGNASQLVPPRTASTSSGAETPPSATAPVIRLRRFRDTPSS